MSQYDGPHIKTPLGGLFFVLGFLFLLTGLVIWSPLTIVYWMLAGGSFVALFASEQK